MVSMLTLFSCTEQWEDGHVTDEKLSANISVVIPQLPEAYPQSRAMALNPQLQNLKLAVFDKNGYLLEYVSATEVELATEHNTTYGYKVQLRPTEEETYIHFIGNAPENIQFGTETEAIGRLFTEKGNEAYWQRIVLPQGIKKNGDAFDSIVTEALTDVRLVRNFAWIQLEKGSEATNFSIDSYCIVNTYKKGSIAPYNTTLGEFADFAHQQTHADLLSEGYNGFIPAGAELDTSIPNESSWFQATGQSVDSYAYFIYEREKALSNPPYILFKGTYTPESGTPMPNRYYKVDLRDQTGNYFPLIRNFRYKVRITKVMHEGHETAALAAAGSGSGDVSTAIETEDYTNISNGVARIFVDYTDITLIEQTDELKLRYKFMVFETKDANDNVVTSEQILNGDGNVTIDLGDETHGKVIESFTKSAADASDGWREITIKTTALGAMSKTQDIIIKGTVTIGEGANQKTYELQRKVTITLTPRYTMQLVCNPNEIANTQGTPFDVVIKVPGDLRPSMFPLDFQLEAAAQSMTPDKGDDLPVVSGKSIIPGKETKTTIGFIKQIQYDDYSALPNVGGIKSITCNFKSNKAASATLIYADNKYFNQASTELKNYTPSTFNPAFNASSLTAGADVTFSFTMSNNLEQGYVYVTLVGLEPVDDKDLVWDSEKNCYKYNPDGTSGSFKLTCNGTADPASVKLSAYHFVDAEKTIDVQLNSFSNLTFNPDYLTPGQTTDVTFEFKMSQVPSSDVYVTLTNLVPADNRILTEVGTNTGKYKFITRPTGTSPTITLRNTVTQAGTVGTVKLSSLGFNDATATISMKYIIPGAHIKLTDSDIPNSNTEFTLYTSDPGKEWWPSGEIDSFTSKKNGTVSDIELTSDQYETIKNNGGKFYVRFINSNWTFYVAEVDLNTIMNGVVPLDFKSRGGL